MANSLDGLARKFLQKSLNECNVEDLYNYAKRYPYFAPAQFLYLKKLDPQSEAYQQHYQKAVFYYKDATLFNYFINKEAFETVWEPLNTVEKQSTSEKESIKESSKIEEEPITPLSIPIVINIPIEGKAQTDSLITFEPFHTVDYFASQGIKLSIEEASKDKFGKQLKSFTEWLKTMKRLPATQMTTLQGQAEKQVENMAAHSVQNAEVVTEAMAEVWLQQGNKAKAAEVYRKLSLLNPSKSAYFAAKIEHLNHSN